MPVVCHPVPVPDHRGGQLLTGVVSGCSLFRGRRGQAQRVCSASCTVLSFSSVLIQSCRMHFISYCPLLWYLWAVWCLQFQVLFCWFLSRQQCFPWSCRWPTAEYTIHAMLHEVNNSSVNTSKIWVRLRSLFGYISNDKMWCNQTMIVTIEQGKKKSLSFPLKWNQK